MAGSPKHIVVVGTGIIGTFAARTLVAAGMRVTLVSDPGSLCATKGSFGWINAHKPQDAHYFKVRLAAMEAWHQLRSVHDDLPVRFNGALDWDLDEVKNAVAQYTALGGVAQALDQKEIAALMPAFAEPPAIAALNGREGVANPDVIAGWAVAQITAEPALEVRQTKVTGIQLRGDTVAGVKTTDGGISADGVVIAAGVKTAALISALGLKLPMQNDLGILVRTNRLPPVAGHVVSMPGLHFWQMDDGRIIAGEDLGGAGAGETNAELFARLVARLSHHFPQIGDIEIQESRLTRRPMPADGHPVVGAAPGFSGLYVACMHSGITLAPLVAAALELEISTGKISQHLAPYRLNRFQN